jgi:hypothetical protein
MGRRSRNITNNGGIYKGLIVDFDFNQGGGSMYSKVNSKDRIVNIDNCLVENNAIKTSGVGSYYMQDDNNPLQKLTNKFTGSVWIKRTPGTSQAGIFIRDEVAGRNIWNLQLTGGGVLLSSIQIDAATSMTVQDLIVPYTSTQIWYHLVCIYNGELSGSARWLMFLNGDKKNVTASTTIPTTPYNISLSRLSIGRPTIKGWLSDVKIWDRPLLESEVKQLYKTEYNLIR